MNIPETIKVHRYLKKRIAEAEKDNLAVFSKSFLRHCLQNGRCPFWTYKQDNGIEILGFYLEKQFEQALVILILSWSAYLPWCGGRSCLHEILYGHYAEHIDAPHITIMQDTVIVKRPECWSIHRHHYLANADEKKRMQYIVKRLKEAVGAFDSMIKTFAEIEKF